MSKKAIQRGDIFLTVNFAGLGSEQVGCRPCVIVSNDVCNTFSGTVTVVPLTSKSTKKELPTHFVLESDKYSLRNSSTVLGEQITTIDKKRLGERHRVKLDESDLKKLDKVLRVQLSLS